MANLSYAAGNCYHLVAPSLHVRAILIPEMQETSAPFILSALVISPFPATATIALAMYKLQPTRGVNIANCNIKI